ncbi:MULTISPECIES: hypothetical protein [Pseudomonas syringae group]|uniref:TaxB conjugal transfer protein n=2 Tax=Pseudomonas syringae group TaxID=136849 RepID=A0A0P9KL53_9PSED|nr:MULTISPECIES: hypothetical protein [Pseudomonas syringae group]RMN45029.1 hypothetical protein ALQ58_200015 [Pseudomonas syringae pv. apii]KPW63226.1 hypothetical protein ALO80_200068 [Pseudomonas caricapapayae]RMM06906.1 hypothetical protein ALQ84_200335 [Pseudomonas caricapapayae]RMN69377.1 hypothetical protein ALQ55_200307 [Pseudomonas savastanoi pv. savastanoi]RMV94294.1 hypothetical protein ALP01_200138 [Pseudomonas caricapapayae]
MSNEKAHLLIVEAKLRKACKSAFFCGVLVFFAMVAIVVLGLAAEQPVDQKAIAQGWTPLIMLMAAIFWICHFFHGLVKNKIQRLDQ